MRNVIPTYYVYIVRCADGTLYTGYTTNLEKRIKDHNHGKGAKYTRGRSPVDLCYAESLTSKTEALRKEYWIKQLTRIQKEQLIVHCTLQPISSASWHC